MGIILVIFQDEGISEERRQARTKDVKKGAKINTWAWGGVDDWVCALRKGGGGSKKLDELLGSRRRRWRTTLPCKLSKDGHSTWDATWASAWGSGRAWKPRWYEPSKWLIKCSPQTSALIGDTNVLVTLRKLLRMRLSPSYMSDSIFSDLSSSL